MGRIPELGSLEGAVQRLTHTLSGGTGDANLTQEALKDVYRVNNEIGRLARNFPELLPALREMQLDVNSLTIRLKNGGHGETSDWVARLRVSMEKVGAAAAELGDDQNLTRD